MEDSPGDARLVEEALSESLEACFDVTHVECLAEALDHLAANEVDVILLDLQLSDSFGLETLQKTHEVAPSTPIVVLTGLFDGEMALKAAEYGVQDYLAKGEMEGRLLLLHTIWHAIERHRLNSKLEQLRQQRIEDQKFQSLGVLSAGIAHDFNNLLMVIVGQADLINRHVGTPACAKQSLEQIKKAGSRAAELCQELLAYSGKGRFAVRPLDLTAVIEEMVPKLQRSLPDNVVLSGNLLKTLPLVEADVTQIRHLLMNLILNAREAIAEKQGAITLTTSVNRVDRAYLLQTLMGADLPEGDYVCVGVSDTGCGMDPELRSNIFEPFFTTKFVGRGLGLSAAYGIVRRHGGTLGVTTEEGHGSTFIILFPTTSATQAAPPPVPMPSGSEWQGRGKVLVVDDEDNVRNVVGEMVRQLGFDVLFAKDGSEGVDLYLKRHHEISLILLDTAMSGLKGMETFKKFRKITKDSRILVMSGSGEAEFTSTVPDSVFSDFIQKPFQFTDLRSKVRALFNA